MKVSIKNVKLMVIAMVVALCVTGCSKNTDFANVIPEDANAVVKVDLPKIISKSGAGDDLMKMVAKQMELNDEETKKLFGSVDMDQPMFIFETGAKEENMAVGIVAAMNDAKDLTAFFQDMKKKGCPEPKEKDGKMCLSLDNETELVYDDNTLLVLSTDKAADKAVKMMVPKEKSFTATEDFAMLMKDESDVAAIGHLRNIFKDYADEVDEFKKEMKDGTGISADDVDKFKELKLMANLVLGDGEATASLKYMTDNKDVKKWIEDNTKLVKRISSKDLAKKSGKSLATVCIGLDGGELYTKLSKLIGAFTGGSDENGLGAYLEEIKNVNTELLVATSDMSMNEIVILLNTKDGIKSLGNVEPKGDEYKLAEDVTKYRIYAEVDMAAALKDFPKPDQTEVEKFKKDYNGDLNKTYDAIMKLDNVVATVDDDLTVRLSLKSKDKGNILKQFMPW